jgi:opacity protein-like surface antigen
MTSWKRRRTACLLIAIALLTAAAAAAAVTGTWELTVTLGGGQGGTATFELEEADGKLTGTYRGQLGDAPVNGTVDGNQVSFSFESQAGKVTYEGTVDGDTMKGKCTYGQLGEGTFEGTKK